MVNVIAQINITNKHQKHPARTPEISKKLTNHSNHNIHKLILKKCVVKS